MTTEPSSKVWRDPAVVVTTDPLIPVLFETLDPAGGIVGQRLAGCRSVPRINEAVVLDGLLCEVQEVTHQIAGSPAPAHVIKVALRRVR